jgi:hypothetical protein
MDDDQLTLGFPGDAHSPFAASSAPARHGAFSPCGALHERVGTSIVDRTVHQAECRRGVIAGLTEGGIAGHMNDGRTAVLEGDGSCRP